MLQFCFNGYLLVKLMFFWEVRRIIVRQDLFLYNLALGHICYSFACLLFFFSTSNLTKLFLFCIFLFKVLTGSLHQVEPFVI